MLDKYLAEVKERADEATPGPWLFHDGTCSGEVLGPAEVWSEFEGRDQRCMIAAEVMHGDEEFIAAARSDVPKLLKIIERLRKAGAYDGVGLRADLEQIVGEP